MSADPHPPAQAAWLRLADDEIDAALLRADARRNVLTIARVIGWSADWRTGRSRPTVARLMERSGLSRRCVQNWCRWLEGRGLLRVLEEGTTPRFRPAILARDGGNLAREWQLADPAEDQSCAPPGLDLDLDLSPEGGSPSRAGARGADGANKTDRRSAADSSPAPSLPRLPPWPSGRNPQRRSEALAAADSLRRDQPVLRRMSARAVRSAVRAYFAAGWTVADVEHALDHLPDGSRHIQTDAVRHPAEWLRSRLAHWLGPDGVPIPGHSAELMQRAELARTERYLAPPERGTPPVPEWYAARAALAARRCQRGQLW